MKVKTPVLAIALDASEASLVERLCAEGKLPAIQSLMERGSYGRLASNGNLFTGAVWPTFLTSRQVPWHGVYHNKMWRQETMRYEVVTDKWLGKDPFWEYLDASYKVGIVDAPVTVKPPFVHNGIQIEGWGTHDQTEKGAYPPGLWQQLEREFGSPNMPSELFGPQSAKTLLDLRKTMLKLTRQMSTLGEALLAKEEWDLFLITFGSTHRGGHYLWDLSQIDSKALDSKTRKVLEGALVEIYQACDRAVGRLVAKAPAGTRVLLFGLHGMGRNPGWSDYCNDIVAKIQQHGATPPKRGLLYRIKRRLPWKVVRQVTTRLPQSVQNRLVSVWSTGLYDWSKTRYFTMPMDLAGYLRVNLKGREAQGIVEPGEEYEAVCRELEEALRSFHDIDTGQPIVGKIYRLQEETPLDAPYRALQPDLVVTWNDISALDSRGVRSEKYGEVRFEGRGKLPSGRTGNHSKYGWALAAGEGIEAGALQDGHGIVDLAPTILNWLGVESPEEFQGKAIAELCSSHTPAEAAEIGV